LGVEYIAEEINLIKFLYCTVTVIKKDEQVGLNMEEYEESF